MAGATAIPGAIDTLPAADISRLRLGRGNGQSTGNYGVGPASDNLMSPAQETLRQLL